MYITQSNSPDNEVTIIAVCVSIAGVIIGEDYFYFVIYFSCLYNYCFSYCTSCICDCIDKIQKENFSSSYK